MSYQSSKLMSPALSENLLLSSKFFVFCLDSPLKITEMYKFLKLLTYSFILCDSKSIRDGLSMIRSDNSQMACLERNCTF